MRFIIIITGLICTLCLSNCTSNNSPSATDNYELNKRTDSLKWLFYAYTFQGKVIFQEGAKEYESINCEVNVDTIIRQGDSLLFLLSYFKDGVKSNHIREGMNLSGFAYYFGAAKPLTGMLVFDEFDNIEYLKRDNYKTDSMFRFFLREADTSQASSWLLNEANKRRVWE
jgi:hypothetical protein